MKIHFKVREQTLWAYGCESPVGGSIAYISCELEFLTKDWDNAPGRYAVFTLKDTDPAVSYTAVIVDGKIDEDAFFHCFDLVHIAIPSIQYNRIYNLIPLSIRD